jgi:hypothetical protein
MNSSLSAFSAVAVLLAFGLSTPAEARPCGAGGFTLYCRGNLQIQNHGSTPSQKDIRFTRATRAAGSTGSTVTPGTCAWEDRPVSIAEPALIKGFVSIADQASQDWFTLVSHCAFDRRCVVEICVANDNQGALRTKSNHAIIRFP